MPGRTAISISIRKVCHGRVSVSSSDCTPSGHSSGRMLMTYCSNPTTPAIVVGAMLAASIAPTTMAGVVGLLQYVISIRPEEWPEGVQSDDDTETRPWHYFLIEMLIAVLPGMAVRS